MRFRCISCLQRSSFLIWPARSICAAGHRSGGGLEYLFEQIYIYRNININIYIYKGYDRVNADIADAADEIKAHIDARWVGPDEAIWRLLEFPLHGNSHSTQRLATHLPGEK